MPAIPFINSYTAHVDELADKALLQEAFTLLPLTRQEHIKNFRYEQDKLLGTAAWLLLLYGLALEGLGIPNESAWQTEGKGKPILPDGPHFNISHSGKRVLVSISQESKIGCDVEKMREWKPNVAKHCLQDSELSGMMALKDPRERACAFTRTWTLKESYMKAKGLGLALAPKSFAISFDETNQPQLIEAAPLSCCFHEYELGENYRCSVCALAPEVRFDVLKQVDLIQALKVIQELNA